MDASARSDGLRAPRLGFIWFGVATLALAPGAGCTEDLEPPVSSSSPELGRPPVSASLDGWTIRSQAARGATRGTVRASVTFDDGKIGGVRSGGTCLVADLELGPCASAQDCVAAAVAEGLPGNGGVPGWFHYCVIAGDRAQGHHPRCWTRPGTQGAFCRLGPAGRPGETRGVELDVTGLPLLEDRPRAWTSLACLAGGIAADGHTPVGEALGCARQSRYVYAIDHAVVVPCVTPGV